MIKAWKFLRASRRLGYGDDRPVEVGVPLEIDGHPILCKRGIHASRCAMDALQYAESAIVARVACEGEIVEGDDKIGCTRLTPLVIFDATGALRAFARLCALDVIDLWAAPDIVRRYLVTGDESIMAAAQAAAQASARAAGQAAAQDAARDAARVYARAAAQFYARDAAQAAAQFYARDAARADAWASAWAAQAAAPAAAQAAAWAAARAAQNARMEQMLMEQIERETQCTTERA